MKCPMCGNENTNVIDSRERPRGVRRRRKCTACDSRFTTIELVTDTGPGRRAFHIVDATCSVDVIKSALNHIAHAQTKLQEELAATEIVNMAEAIE